VSLLTIVPSSRLLTSGYSTFRCGDGF